MTNDHAECIENDEDNEEASLECFSIIETEQIR